MKNKWFTYGFLLVLIVALCSLAVLQYRWLGSVSEAEKTRLKENLSASMENFVADFDRVFDGVYQSFRLQVISKDVNYESLIAESYDNWQSVTNYSALVDSIYLIKGWEGEASVVLFSRDSSSLTEIKPSPAVQNWIEKNQNAKASGSYSVSLMADPDLGNPSFISVPIKLLNVVTLNEERLEKNLRVNLSVNQSDEIILIRLNDVVIKNAIIPGIAKIYFSDSFRDQYSLSLINTNLDDSVYYSSHEGEVLSAPDFKNPLRRVNFTNVMFYETKDDSESQLATLRLDSMEMTRVNSAEVNSKFNGSEELHSIDSVRSNNFNRLVNTETKIDTTWEASFLGNYARDDWQVWLSLRAGSLDAFVNKTKNKNLLISFGILLILGISGVLIVIFAQRSRELADQQMLFVAGVSHELRTPVTVIRSAAENLSEGVIQNKERREEYAQLMLKEGRRLSGMIDQIMEFSGIQSGKKVYQIQEIDISELVGHIKSETEPLLREKNMKLEYAVSTRKKTMPADFEGLAIALMNLIQNAVKFSPEHSVIKFRLDDVKRKGKEAIRFSVQDSGMGIPEDEKKDIFQPFYRGRKSVEDQVKGNGIGLSLVQKIAEAHDGEVQVQSEEGSGSTFKLIISLYQHE